MNFRDQVSHSSEINAIWLCFKSPSFSIALGDVKTHLYSCLEFEVLILSTLPSFLMLPKVGSLESGLIDIFHSVLPPPDEVMKLLIQKGTLLLPESKILEK